MKFFIRLFDIILKVFMGSRMLLIGGLGQTDLSGKVPRPGLLALRHALRRSGHDAVIINGANTLSKRMFSPEVTSHLKNLYARRIRPQFIDGLSPKGLGETLSSLLDLLQLKRLTRELQLTEMRVFQDFGREISEMVSREGFDAVGFSLYLGSSTSGSIIISDILRGDHPNLPIFFGGPQTTHFAETIYSQTTSPTALVLGEGEISIVALANIIDQLKAGQLSSLHKIPNLTYRNEKGSISVTPRARLSLEEWKTLSAIPYEEDDFSGLMRYAFIETSRGCFWQCHFCSQPLLSGINRLLKPASQIVDEMVSLNQKFGLRNFEFVGSSTPPWQAEEIADEIRNRGLAGQFSWVLFMRGRDQKAPSVELPVFMKKLKDAGAVAIFFGVEAADNATLKRMGKKETIEEIAATMSAAKQAGIFTIGSFIYPYPGMPDNEKELIVDFVRSVQPDSSPAQSIGLYPKTYDAEHAAEIGCEIVYPKKTDQILQALGFKSPASMDSPEVLQYLLTYPLILSLPMRLWPPLPYKIDGASYRKFVAKLNELQKELSGLGTLSGFSHSHFLLSHVMGISPKELSERMFYCNLTGDQKEVERLINLFNQQS